MLNTASAGAPRTAGLRVEAHSYANDNVAYQLMYVFANLAVDGNFNFAQLDVQGLPASMDIDYIRVYQERD